MTGIIMNGLERTIEVRDWAKDARMKKLAAIAFRDFPCSPVEREMHVQCCLVVVNAKKPPTYAAAKQLLLDTAAYKLIEARQAVTEYRPDPRTHGQAPCTCGCEWDQHTGRHIVLTASDERHGTTATSCANCASCAYYQPNMLANRKAPKRVPEGEKAGVRAAIEEHAKAEQEWQAGRGKRYTLEDLTRMTKAAFVDAEKRRARK